MSTWSGSAQQRVSDQKSASNELEIITLFLGCAAELAADQRVFADFVAELNRITVDHGMFFKLVNWQWDGRNDPLKDYGAAIRESALVLFLYFTVGDAAMETRFNQALEAFRAVGKPQIITWFKAVPTGNSISAELERFRDQLDTQLHHFYNTYETLDSVKLGVLLQLVRDVELAQGIVPGVAMTLPGASLSGMATGLGASASETSVPIKSPLTIEGDSARLWGAPIIDLTQVPAYAGWQTLSAAKAALAEVDEQLTAARVRAAEQPDDAQAQEAWQALARVRGERAQAVEAAEHGFLDFMRSMSRATATGSPSLTERQRQAYRLAEQGKLDAAITLLDEQEIARDADAAELELKSIEAMRVAALARLKSHIAEQLQLVELLKSRDSDATTSQRIESLLRDSAAREARNGAGYRAQLQWGLWLAEAGRSCEAEPMIEAAVRELEHELEADTDDILLDYATALLHLGDCRRIARDFEAMERVAEQLLTFLAARRPLWLLLRTRAELMKAAAQALQGRLRDSADTLDALLVAPSPGKVAVDAAELERLMAMMFSLLAGVLAMMDNTAEAQYIAGFAVMFRERVAKMARTRDDGRALIAALAVYAAMLAADGEPSGLKRARSEADESVELARYLARRGAPEDLLVLVQALFTQGVVRDAVGAAGVTDSLAEARALAKRLVGSSVDALAVEGALLGIDFTLALRCKDDGELDDARALLVEAADLLAMQGVEAANGNRCMGYAVYLALLEVCDAQGDTEHAREAARWLFEALEAGGPLSGDESGFTVDDAGHVLARVARDEGFSRDERVRAADALCELTQSGFERGRLHGLCAYARAHRLRGSVRLSGDAAAVEDYLSACEVYARLLDAVRDKVPDMVADVIQEYRSCLLETAEALRSSCKPREAQRCERVAARLEHTTTKRVARRDTGMLACSGDNEASTRTGTATRHDGVSQGIASEHPRRSPGRPSTTPDEEQANQDVRLLLKLGERCLDDERWLGARRYLESALSRWERSSLSALVAEQLSFDLGEAQYHLGDLAASERSYRQAAQYAQQEGAERAAAGCWCNVGGMCVLQGELHRGIEAYRTAYLLALRAGCPEDAQKYREGLTAACERAAEED